MPTDDLSVYAPLTCRGRGQDALHWGECSSGLNTLHPTVGRIHSLHGTTALQMTPFPTLKSDFCCDCPIVHEAKPSGSAIALHITWLWIRLWLSSPSPQKNLKKISNWLNKNEFCSVWQNYSLLGQLIFQYYILFWFILWIRHTIHKFGFTGLKYFCLLLIMFSYIYRFLSFPAWLVWTQW